MTAQHPAGVDGSFPDTAPQQILFCSGGGCTAKLGPGILQRVLSRLPAPTHPDPDLLVGYDHADDAAVLRLTDDLAVVHTLDFFPPVVDDPHLFGQIVAANAMSDVWAMGGVVRTALNIVCFPETMDLNILGAILAGGAEKVHEAGGSLAGGHSIMDDSVKYGLSVTGTVNPQRLYRNDTARPGNVLVLTKPLGTGIVCAAHRLDDAPAGAYQAALESMTALNRRAAELLADRDVHAVTDVTGFGLLGHLLEMVGDRLTATIDTLTIPELGGARRLAEEFYLTAAAQRNRDHAGDRVTFRQVPFGAQEVLFDPQTSGGLLVALPRADAQAYAEELASERAAQGSGLAVAIIGTIGPRQGAHAVIVQ